jgi:hypothetical protein
MSSVTELEAIQDRRSAPRVVFCDPIEVVGDAARFEARATDLSAAGLAIDGDELEPGARVRVRFCLDRTSTRRIDAVARVVRRGAGRVGLRFEQLAWIARADLHDYVTAVRQGTPWPRPLWH